MKKYLSAFLVLFFVVVIFSQDASKLYLSSGSTGRVYEVNTTNGAVTAITTPSYFNANNGTAVSSLALGYDTVTPNPLVFMHANTASASTLYKNGQNTGTGLNLLGALGGLTTNNVPGNYYGFVYGMDGKRMYRAYPTSADLGAITGDTTWTNGTTFATDVFFDYQNNFYCIITNGSERYLYKINLATPTVATQVSKISGPVGTVNATANASNATSIGNARGAAYLNGFIYLVSGTETNTNINFYKVNINDGVSSHIATTTVAGSTIGGGNLDLASVPYYVPFNFNCAGATLQGGSFIQGTSSTKTMRIPISNVITPGTYNINVSGADFTTSVATLIVAASSTYIDVPINYTGSGNIGTRNVTFSLNGSSTSCVIPVTIAGKDSDGDGVPDWQDLDSDNDGILDTVECPTTELVTNGTFTGNANGWTLGTGWTYINNYINNQNNGSNNYALTQTLNNLDKVKGSVVALNLNLGAQDGTQAAGSTASLNIKLNGVIYATLNNSTLRDNSNITITMANGATSNFVTYGTNGVNGFNWQNFTIYIPYTGPTSATLSFEMTSANDDWALDDISIKAMICDTDGDGIPNYLDLDSDGDGCVDAIEGGANFTNADLHTATGTIATQTPNQNLGNTVGMTTTTLGVPTIAGTGQTIGQSQDFSKNDCIDSDGDGVPDWKDLDNDNDGILDSNECSEPVYNIVTWFNTGNYNADPDPEVLTGQPSTVGAGLTRTIHAVDNYQIISGIDALNESSAIVNNEYVEYTIHTIENIGIKNIGYYQNTGVSTTNYHYSVRMSKDNFATNVLVHGDKLFNPTIKQDFEVAVNNGVLYLEAGITYKFRVYFYNVSGNNTTPIFHDDFKLLGSVECDTDGDGIPNRLDLDSDGDGCPDAIEGGANFTNADLHTATGIIASQTPNQNLGNTVDANGVPIIAGVAGQGVGNAQNTMLNDCIAFVCPPDPYAAQQTWWLPSGTNKVRIDFQTGSAVLNNPASGFLGQGTFNGFEGNTTVTHPVTGELLFVTDGNVVYKGATGAQATGPAVGGTNTTEEAAAVIPDPQGVLGRDFIIFGNSAANSPGGLLSAKYNLDTNVISGVTSVLPFNTIYESLEVIPHTNGTDYWILVNTVDQKVKSYLYSKASGFNSTAVSSTDVSNLAGASSSAIAVNSFISWDPRIAGKLLIARHNKVGLANFNPSTGALGTWEVKVTVNSAVNTVDQNSTTGYSAAISPNGRYIYYNEYNATNNTGILKYYDIQSGLTTSLEATSAGMNGLKIAPDGRLYKIGYVSNNRRLFYLNTNANTPPSNVGSLLQFNTDGRDIGLQFPNNVYWGCMVCQSGTDAPILANTTINANVSTIGNLISLLSASNQPTGTVITIHSGTPATDANKLTNNTAVVSGSTYYVAYYDGLAICFSPTTAIIVKNQCYKPGIMDAENTYPSQQGITALGRAGANNGNWPMLRESAWTVLESKEKGFVVNRVATTAGLANITNPIEGMIVYDTEAKCLKIYTLKEGDAAMAWHCMITPACPD
ncbi:beta strand repeat-containing protein [Soonwooa purpurea]